MKGLILAGGHGTRLRPLTFSGNKHMLPIANQPILFYGLQHLAAAGIQKVAIILGPIHEGIKESIGSGESLGLEVEYIHQGDPKGLAHAVICARDFLGKDPFVMYLGDNLLQEGVGKFCEAYRLTRADAVIGVTPTATPQQYGIIEMDGNRILSIEEKPSRPRSNLALIGVYLFDAAIHPILEQLRPSPRGELEITEAIWTLYRSGHTVVARRVDGWWKDTGRPEDLLEANELVLNSRAQSSFRKLGEIQSGAHLVGDVGLGAGTIVEGHSSIVGPVVVGAGAQILGNARIGPGTSIGDGAIVNGVSVKHSIVMAEALLEGEVSLTDSLIGRRAEIRATRPIGHDISLVLGDSSRLRL